MIGQKSWFLNINALGVEYFCGFAGKQIFALARLLSKWTIVFGYVALLHGITALWSAGQQKINIKDLDTGTGQKVQPYRYQEYWIFYDKLNMPGYEAYTYRPFFISQKHFFISSGVRYLYTDRLFFLPPVLDIFETRRFSNYSFLQVFDFSAVYPMADSLDVRGQAREGDLGIFPFFWYGWGQYQRDKYWAFFPLYGTIKGKLGQDYIHFALFPIWTNYGFKKVGYDATSIYWPFFLHGRAPDRMELRVFPFFHYSSQDNNFVRMSVLWPLFFYERNYLYSTAPQTLRFIFPIYGSKTRNLAESYSVFWPFFSWGWDAVSQTKEYTLLWPLFHWGDGKEPVLKKRYFFPVYGYYQHGNKQSQYITPFFFSMLNAKKTYTSRQDFILPMFWLSEVYKPAKENPKELRKAYFYFKFWPVLHVQNDYQNESYQVNIFSPLWFKADQSIEDFYSPFWSIFTYKKLPMAQLSNIKKWYQGLPAGRQNEFQFEYISVLFRLYSQWEIGDIFHWQIPLLASYTSQKDHGMRFRLLHGFFEVNNLDQDDKKSSIPTKNPKQKSYKYRFLWFIKI